MEPRREEYYLLIQGETAGPFTLAELHEMWMADKITLDTLFVRPGMKKCQPINLILGMVINYQVAQAQPAAAPAVSEEDNPLEPLKKLVRWGVLVSMTLAFLWLIGPWRQDEEVTAQVMRATIEVKPADLHVFNESDFEWRDMVVYVNGTPPAGYKRKLENLKPQTGKDMTLLEFTDFSGTPFEPWRMTVGEVWIGNDKIGYRTFRVRTSRVP